MGQVAIDLPDPLHNSDPAPGPSADDLLAQLAGEEIDPGRVRHPIGDDLFIGVGPRHQRVEPADRLAPGQRSIQPADLGPGALGDRGRQAPPLCPGA